MTTTKKKQHFVPQLYLKNFATSESKGSKHERVFCYKKSVKKVLENQSVVQVGHENYFYQLAGDTEQKIENAFADAENLFGPALDTLINGKDLNKLTSEEKGALSVFVALQYNRTKQLRLRIPSFLWFAESEMVKEGTIPHNFLQRQNVLDAESIKKRHLTIMASTLKPILGAIFQMEWMLVENRSNTPFITSDNPVVLVDRQAFSQNTDANLLGLVGWIDSNENVNPDLVVICPLSPELALMLYTNHPLSKQIIEEGKDTRFLVVAQRSLIRARL